MSREPDENVLTWSVHLVRRNPGAIPGLVLSILGAAIIITLLFHSAITGLVAVLLLTGTVKEFLFPMRFRVTDSGVEAQTIGSHMVLAWKDVRRCMLEASQITLTPLAVPSRLDVFRGVTLKFGYDGERGDRDQVLAMCRKHLPGILNPGEGVTE